MKTDEIKKDGSRREWLAVAVITLIGAVLRAWPIGHLGLTHFDEGIYALTSFGIQPLQDLIPYAPPGYPFLASLMSVFLGSTDSSLIRTSQIAGILTIPVVAWLGRRTFGPGAGFASAVFCAFSGPHIAFSRMGLTDASALLAWLLAIGAGMRFLESPGFVRAIVMGLAVGLAQEFKYNGWMTGGIVIATALMSGLVQISERKLTPIVRTFGWGIVAAGVAWLVVWPWYAYVEAHGGYAALLRHQRSYLGGFSAWLPNLVTQADQAVALSDAVRLVLPALALSFLTPFFRFGRQWVEMVKNASNRQRFFWLVSPASVAWLYLYGPFLSGFLAIPWMLRSSSRRIVLLWWFILLVSSPFYHPYARLWLPFHASHWLILSWLLADVIPSLRLTAPGKLNLLIRREDLIPMGVSFLVLCVLGQYVNVISRLNRPVHVQPDLLAPSDSLHNATNRLSLLLPDDVKGLQLLVRPPVTFYLLGRLPLFRMPDSEALLKPGPRGVWALVDSSLLRSELGKPPEGKDRNFLDRFAKDWEVVEEFRNNLSLPTALDVDPAVARSASADRNCSLWLLRPRRPGAKP